MQSVRSVTFTCEKEILGCRSFGTHYGRICISLASIDAADPRIAAWPADNGLWNNIEATTPTVIKLKLLARDVQRTTYVMAVLKGRTNHV